MADRFYIGNSPVALNHEIEIPEGEAWHLIKVMRTSPGDVIEIFGGGKQYQAEVSRIEGKRAWVTPLRPLDALPELTVKISYALPWLKGGKTEYVAQKLTELGVAEIIIFKARREVVHGKIDRIHRVVMEACKQCGRSDIPFVRESDSIQETFLEQFAHYPASHKILLYENETNHMLSSCFSGYCFSSENKILLASGPEGGFDPREIENLPGEIQIASLGQRILRADTAAIGATAAVLALSGNM